MDERPRRGSGTRLVTVGVVLVLAWTMVGYRLTVVQGARAEEFAARGLDQRLQHRTLAADRGTIFDRDGRELAVTVESVTVYANPFEMQDPARVASLLAPLVGPRHDRPARRLHRRLAFVYVVGSSTRRTPKRSGTPTSPGSTSSTEPKRVVPDGRADRAGRRLRARADDNVGLEGLELQYDNELVGHAGGAAGRARSGGPRHPPGRVPGGSRRAGERSGADHQERDPVRRERALSEAMERTGAEAGSVVVIDPDTGEVLAMVNLPAYDPSDRASIDEDAVRNRTVTDVFEPGSTQKLVTISAALEAGLVTPGTLFDIPDKIEIQDTVFEDFDHPSEHSDGVRDRRQLVEPRHDPDRRPARGPALQTYMSAFGEGERPASTSPARRRGAASLRGVVPHHLSSPAPRSDTTCRSRPCRWPWCTPPIANDGVWVQPHLVRRGRRWAGEPGLRSTAIERRVRVRRRPRQQMRSMLAAVVEQGTGSLAAVPGTGSVARPGPPRSTWRSTQAYSKDQVVASFIGMAPIDDPRVVVAVVLDSPVGVRQRRQWCRPGLRRGHPGRPQPVGSAPRCPLSRLRSMRSPRRHRGGWSATARRS